MFKAKEQGKNFDELIEKTIDKLTRKSNRLAPRKETSGETGII
jgi:hypothetical protein